MTNPVALTQWAEHVRYYAESPTPPPGSDAEPGTPEMGIAWCRHYGIRSPEMGDRLLTPKDRYRAGRSVYHKPAGTPSGVRPELFGTLTGNPAPRGYVEVRTADGIEFWLERETRMHRS